ncbi:MAG: galactose-1-phosphate uridylyltransferase [Dehalococcoidia bacterium]|nr:galactose-1-phosphate uridylyltransferase [Dehalococcoidia bacterium]MBL7061343.1 galactose-1-phosphate uridylyltransferase [Dehalococcoidia bacterium]
MSEIRQDPTTKEWVIIAPERAKRPQHMPKRMLAHELPSWEESCPFCPGNESQTPDEVLRFPPSAQGSAWEVRVVPNRFAALSLSGNLTRREEGHLFRKMDGVGVNEVIIETPSHNTPIALMTREQVEKVLVAYQQRYNTLKENRQLKFITIFKNHGWASGTSLIHPHSQLVATPLATTYYRRKFDVAVDYYDNVGRCLYCDLIAEELRRGERIIAETKEFIVLHPFASRVPYETWIIPKRHCASFGLCPATGLTELSTVLRDTLLCLHRGLDNPAFNYMFDTSTTEDEEDPYYHWHIRIVPRLTTIAGFEMGSGIYINTALPEDTAKVIKKMLNSLKKGAPYPDQHALSDTMATGA